MAFARDIATDKIGDDVFVHIVYASCPAAHEGGESYFIRYRRGHYNVNNGPASFAWDMDPETISGAVAAPLKMQPTLAVNRDHRLYAFWSDSANCAGAPVVFDNIEIYGQTGTLNATSPPSWTWLATPRRVSQGGWCSDWAVAVADNARPHPYTHIVWRDGRNALFDERTDMYYGVWNDELDIYPGGGQLLSSNGGKTRPSNYTGVPLAASKRV